MRIPIPEEVSSFALYASNFVVPARRTGGFKDSVNRPRGYGDAIEIIANVMVFTDLAARGVQTTLNLHSGGGDDHDLIVRNTNWNVKASSFAPLREGLHLYVKDRDVEKNIAGFMQVFVHLGEAADPEPHVHICGVASLQKVRQHPVGEIPKTGWPGYGVPLSLLAPYENFAIRAAA